MKKSLALLLSVVLLFTLSACVDVPPAADPVPVEPMLCTVLEGERLYAQPLDGSAMRLLVDARVTGWDRRGDDVVAAFDDNTIRRIDLTTGEEQVLYTSPVAPFEVYWCDSGFVYLHATMASSTLYYYNTEAGTCAELLKDSFSNQQVVGDTLYYTSYNMTTQAQQLVALNLTTGEEPWCVDLTDSLIFAVFDGELYATRTVWNGSGGGPAYELLSVDTATGTMTALKLPFDLALYQVQYVSPYGYLVSSRDWEDNRLYFVTPDGAQTELPLTAGTEAYPRVYDVEGATALLGAAISSGADVLEQPIKYVTRELYLLDMTTGEATALPYVGENGKLFATGDFPVLDSSTARKPITRAIYSLFCLESGSGGNMPVCNTTHGAWLALADKTTDIALLAAPTEEEQAYLAEKGVEIEMKLYGGDGLVFIANRASGVENLTMEQVRAIYRGEVKNWSELGGADAPITVLYRDSQSGSQRLFERMVWTDEPVPDLEALGFKKEEEMSSIVRMVVDDPYAIGYSIMTYLRDVYEEPDLVALSLEGAAPTPDNVANGTYPMGTKGYVVIRADEPAGSPARRLYDWFGSPMSDQILTQNGVTPMSE